MNTLTILSTLVIFTGLIASYAFVVDNMNSLDATEFFYGDSVVNKTAVIRTPDAGKS